MYCSDVIQHKVILTRKKNWLWFTPNIRFLKHPNWDGVLWCLCPPLVQLFQWDLEVHYLHGNPENILMYLTKTNSGYSNISKGITLSERYLRSCQSISTRKSWQTLEGETMMWMLYVAMYLFVKQQDAVWLKSPTRTPGKPRIPFSPLMSSL